MGKKLSDYLHFYVGCDILITDTDGQQFVDKVESVIKDHAGNRFSIYECGDMPFENHEEYQFFQIFSKMKDGERFDLTT